MAKTALVTGASAGLGREFARALAARGTDLILTARRADRLEALAETLRHEHGVTVHVLPADLGQPGAAASLLREVSARDLVIDLLVNNAGFGKLGAFIETDADQLDAMLDLNCRAVMDLARAVLPDMARRGSGAVLNVASTAAFLPGPFMAVYYASKAFVLHLSEALHEEMKPHGVTVAALCPGPTRTEFFEVADAADTEMFDRMASDPQKVVADGLAALDANEAVRVSGVGNRLLALSTRAVPRGLLRRTVAKMQKGRGSEGA